MKAWEEVLIPPVSGRTHKPREAGYTMVIDKGMGLLTTRDLVQTAADDIDNIKFTFGTSAFYDKDFLIEKNRVLNEADILTMPGGTFGEVAVWKDSWREYLQHARRLGFRGMEISDGTIEMSLEQRAEVVKTAVDMGLTVLTEIGKKDPKMEVPMAQRLEQLHQDLECGAFKVIVEARAAGKGVGIFDESGEVIADEIAALLAGVDDVNNLVWEAPIKSQQQYLILQFGPNVNLGNIPPEEILALEALRTGLRGDTLKRAYFQDIGKPLP